MVGVVAVIGIVIGLILSNMGYRSILVEDVVGTTIVMGDKANGTSSKSGEGQKHQQCSVCGYDDPSSYTSIPALTHTYSAIGYQSNGGSTHTVTYECPNCHDSYTTSESCDMADVVTGYLPGDPSTGVSRYNVISYVCQKCGYVQQIWNQPIYP